MAICIRVENLSKQYRLGEVGTGTLIHDLNKWWHNFRGMENPYLKIGEENNREVVGKSDYVWVLDDINFELNQGEVLGVIGRNGAGKSTLLKILSRTTAPTLGSIGIKGRVASLLEVGTGFHPDLTARENVYLNGAIMGMRKTEITRRLDEIIDFAGIDRFVDTPIKRYSSGMEVRLAFSVAAHLNSDILIVDEVLAVGDAEFQKKCLGKMSEVSYENGRTVLFVSHNMKAILNLCNRAILLEQGKLLNFGVPKNIVDQYLNNINENRQFNWAGNISSIGGEVQLEHVKSLQFDDSEYGKFLISKELIIEAEFDFQEAIDGIAFEMFVIDREQVTVFSFYTPSQTISAGKYKVQFKIPEHTLNDLCYQVTIAVSKSYLEFLLKADEIISVNLCEEPRGTGYQGVHPGCVRPEIKWSVNQLF